MAPNFFLFLNETLRTIPAPAWGQARHWPGSAWQWGPLSPGRRNSWRSPRSWVRELVPSSQTWSNPPVRPEGGGSGTSARTPWVLGGHLPPDTCPPHTGRSEGMGHLAGCGEKWHNSQCTDRRDLLFLKENRYVLNNNSLFTLVRDKNIETNLSSVQFSGSIVSDSATPWIAARQASLSINLPHKKTGILSKPTRRKDYLYPTIYSTFWMPGLASGLAYDSRPKGRRSLSAWGANFWEQRRGVGLCRWGGVGGGAPPVTGRLGQPC